ncbi:MAG: sugar ABC transporter permease [Ruminococcaceae bacterium]|nr:sugar ABC transporter permease [Oscillospiraceae bacterium]
MRNKKVTGIERLKVRYGRMFVLPWTIGLLLFFLVPLFSSIAYAFCNVSLVNDKMLTFAGLEHFKYLLNEDPNFMNNIKDAVASFTYSLPIIVALSLIFAIILNQKFKGRIFARAVFFLPVIIATGVVMQFVTGAALEEGAALSTSMGETESYSGIRFDELLVNLGLPQSITELLSDYIARVFNLVWSCGIQILLFVAGLQSIPDQLYEVSKIEGATTWEEFWFVTFPMLGNVTFLVLVYTIVDLFTAFDNPIMKQAYDLITVNSIYDRSAAVLWAYFVVVGVVGALILLAYNRILMKKWN